MGMNEVRNFRNLNFVKFTILGIDKERVNTKFKKIKYNIKYDTCENYCACALHHNITIVIYLSQIDGQVDFVVFHPPGKGR